MEKLDKVRKFAQFNLKVSQGKSKKNYNKKAKPRQFLPGQDVLLFLPIPGNPLSRKYSGPYTVQKQLNPVNYIIATPDRRKKSQMVHVNLIKPYHSRQPEEACGDPVKVKELGNTIDDSCGAATLCVAKTNPVRTTEDTDGADDGEMASWPSFQEPLSNTALLKNLSQHCDKLSSQQQSDVACLNNQYPSVTSDSPGFCTYLFHEVKLISASQSPIRQAP